MDIDPAMMLKSKYQLGAEKQQDDRADAESPARTNQKQQNNWEECGGRDGCGDLHERLGDGGEFWFKADEHADGNGPEAGEKKSKKDAEESGARRPSRCW